MEIQKGDVSVTDDSPAADEMLTPVRKPHTPQSSTKKVLTVQSSAKKSQKGTKIDESKKTDDSIASKTDEKSKTLESQQKVLDYIHASLSEQTSAFQDFASYMKQKLEYEKEKDKVNQEKEQQARSSSQIDKTTNEYGGELYEFLHGGNPSDVQGDRASSYALSGILESSDPRDNRGNRGGLRKTAPGSVTNHTPHRERENKTSRAAGTDCGEDQEIEEFSGDSDVEEVNDILEEYEDETDDTVTSAVHPTLAKRLDKMLSSKQSSNDLKTILANCKRAQNIERLRNISVNSEIYALMNSKQRQIDHAQRLQAHCLQKSLCPISSVLDKLIAFEGTLDKTEDGRMVYSRTGELNVTEVRRQLDQATRLIASVFYNLTMRRRQNIKSCLDPSFQALCGSQTPFTDKLFGDNLEETMQILSNTNKLKLKAGRKQFTPSRQRPFYRRGGTPKNFTAQRAPGPHFRGHTRSRPVFHRRGVARRGQFSRPGGRSTRR